MSLAKNVSPGNFFSDFSEAIENLREAVTENTSVTQRSRSRRRAGGSHASSAQRSQAPLSSRANGMPLLKEDKTRAKRDKVRKK